MSNLSSGENRVEWKVFTSRGREENRVLNAERVKEHESHATSRTYVHSQTNTQVDGACVRIERVRTLLYDRWDAHERRNGLI